MILHYWSHSLKNVLSSHTPALHLTQPIGRRPSLSLTPLGGDERTAAVDRSHVLPLSSPGMLSHQGPFTGLASFRLLLKASVSCTRSTPSPAAASSVSLCARPSTCTASFRLSEPEGASAAANLHASSSGQLNRLAKSSALCRMFMACLSCPRSSSCSWCCSFQQVQCS